MSGLPCEISYRWVEVEAAQGRPFLFPSSVTAYMKEQYSHAAVYRWAFYKSGNLVKAYVGEATVLSMRIPGYLKPGPTQHTNIRINQLISTCIKDGLEVRLEVLDLQPVRINNVLISNAELGNPYVRLMMENFIVADCDKVNCEI